VVVGTVVVGTVVVGAVVVGTVVGGVGGTVVGTVLGGFGLRGDGAAARFAPAGDAEGVGRPNAAAVTSGSVTVADTCVTRRGGFATAGA
jgi:hypothetical protein